VIIINTKK